MKRKKNFIFLAFVLILSLLMSISATAISTKTTPSQINYFLITNGVPEDVVNMMSIEHKTLVYETLNGKEIEFLSYDIKNYSIQQNNEMLLVDAYSINSSNSEILPCGGLLTDADISLSVFGAKIIQAGEDGCTYAVYPACEWKKYVNVSNDSFAMSMYPGWEAIAGKENFVLYTCNSNGDLAASVELDPTASNYSGYVYKIPSNIGSMQGLYKGYAYYHLNKTNSNASPTISLYYAHDTSTLINLSYSLNLGIGSISVSGDTNKLDVMSGNFSISGVS